MRTTGNLQVLTTPTINKNGYAIHTDSIDWSEYLKNPVLLYHPETEDHGGVTVGTVSDIRTVGMRVIGRLNFMENYSVADIAWEKYSQGVLRYVSIGGYGAGYEEDGVFHTVSYSPREHSLVKYPANIECVKINESELDASDLEDLNEFKKKVQNVSEKQLEVRYLTMSVAGQVLTDKDIKEMEKPLNASEAEAKAEQERIEAAAKEKAEQERIEAAAKEAEAKAEQERIEAAAKEKAEQERIEAAAKEAEAKAEQERIEAAAKEKAEQERIEAAAKEAEAKAEQERIEAAERERLQGLQWHEQSNKNKTKINYSEMNYREIIASADFRNRLNAFSSALRTGAPKTDATPENAETVKILASAMLADADMVILASRTNVTNEVTRERKNGLEILVNCAAGEAAAATLAAADLGVIKYLSLFFEKMLTSDTFRRSIRFVPMSDKTGAIYIEDNVQTPTYVGNHTPVNAPLYMYEDIKRTIARQVFAFQPILFQHSELAVLAYDKQGHGLKTTMNTLMQNISTYWLQVIANTPGVLKQYTSGDVVSSAGMFPIEAPTSGINLNKPTLNDLIALQGLFLMQNYEFNEGRKLEVVLPSNVFTALASDPELRNQLTLESSTNLSSFINFASMRIAPRNPVCRFNTASDAPELDPALYADKVVAADGTATDIVPATTTADHVGAGIAFVEGEVIAGVGAIELIATPSPQNYGTVISGWVSTGCTVARSNGQGVSLIVPAAK